MVAPVLVPLDAVLLVLLPALLPWEQPLPVHVLPCWVVAVDPDEPPGTDVEGQVDGDPPPPQCNTAAHRAA